MSLLIKIPSQHPDVIYFGGADPTAGVQVFFFSSRRRHTRCGRDWSSDVCSSDLKVSRTLASPSRNSTCGYTGCRVYDIVENDGNLTCILECISCHLLPNFRPTSVHLHRNDHAAHVVIFLSCINNNIPS